MSMSTSTLYPIGDYGQRCSNCGTWYYGSAHTCHYWHPYTTYPQPIPSTTTSIQLYPRDRSAEIEALKSDIEDLQDEIALLNRKVAKLRKRAKSGDQ